MTEKKTISFSGTCLTKNLNCKLGEIKSIDDLKKKITSETNIKDNQFSFEQQNPFEYFKKMKYGDSLKIKLSNLPKKILFYLHFLPDNTPNETKIIEMQNIPTKTEQIINTFNSEGIFLSDNCKIDIEFEFSKLNSDKEGVPNISVDVNEKSKIKTIKFYKYFFLFDNNEAIGSVKKAIENFLQKHIGSFNSSVEITKNKLSEVTEDDIICTNQFTFITEGNNTTNITNNILATILDAKLFLADIFDDDKKLTPKDIMIKCKGTEINDDKQLLLEFGRNVQFSFLINKITTREAKATIKINFRFEENSQIKFDPFVHSFDIDTTIQLIGDFIKEKYNIDNQKKIDIKYDENNIKYIVDIKMNLEDILEEMKQKNEKGRPINVLYVEIKDKPVRTPRKIKPKTHPVKDDQLKPAQKQQIQALETKRQPIKSQKPAKTAQDTPAKINYIFKYEKKEQKLDLQGDSLLKDHEKRIKELFDLDKAIEIEFKNDDQILDPNKPLNSINNSKVIQLSVVSKPNIYLYQTNRMSKIGRIELSPEATVKDFKIAIAKENHVDNLANIKILFAGKDLLDDIVLAAMNIGNKPIFVYIRSTEDILLMSAKALTINRVNVNNEEEEEYSDEDL